MASSPQFKGILFGAAYYAEYQAAGTLDRDLDLMRDAGFSVIRVGESVWSTWEPREGHFELDWLQPVLDGAHARGIGVILGTPTYAVPPWLQRLHPEIAAESKTGQRNDWGTRQEMDQSHPAYRFYAERVVRKVVSRYADHPAVIGFQVDNEPGMQLPHNEHTFQRFVDWLKDRYGSVEALNEAWGLVYWSHRLSDWADLWRPDGNGTPQYQLEWRRFQSTLATELVAWQADLVRRYSRTDQFITTCMYYARPQLADDQMVKSLDVVAGNSYYRVQEGLYWDAEFPRQEQWPWHSGVWALFEWGDRAWSSAQAQYLVTETNAYSIGGSWQNFPPFPGQLRQAAFALLARGGRMIEYWHWHTIHFGTETYWGGVLPHSGQPGRVYREAAELGSDLKAIGDALDSYVPDADVLLLYSNDTKWAFEYEPPLGNPDGSANHNSYLDIFDAFYRGFFEVGAQSRMQHVSQFTAASPAELAGQFPVMVVPGLHIADDATLERLRDYAAAGGHLIIGVRTGYGDELGKARATVAPSLLSEASGVHYGEFFNLTRPLNIEPSAGELVLEPGSAGTGWVDLLHVDDAKVLARYVPTELGAEAALTTRAFGLGQVSYLGTVPNNALSRSLAAWAVPQTAKKHWQAPEPVTVATGLSAGRKIAFVSNWSARADHVVAPAPALDLVSGLRYAVGDLIPLEPRTARVFEVLNHSIG